MAAITQAEVVRRVRGILGDNPYVSSSSTSMTNSTTTITVVDSAAFSVGDHLEWADGDVARVTALASATTLTIVRGVKGSTATSHAANAEFVVNPGVYYLSVTDAVKTVLETLWPYAWKAVTTTVTPVAGTHWYGVSAASRAVDVIDANQVASNNTELNAYGSSGRTYPVQLVHGAPTIGSANTGISLYFRQFFNTSNTIAVRLRAPLTATIATSAYSDIDDADGLLIQTVVYGAVEQLVLGSEVPRELLEDVTMANATVRPGDRIRLSAYWHQKFVEFRNQLHLYLMETIPPMRLGRQGSMIYR